MDIDAGDIGGLADRCDAEGVDRGVLCRCDQSSDDEGYRSVDGSRWKLLVLLKVKDC